MIFLSFHSIFKFNNFFFYKKISILSVNVSNVSNFITYVLQEVSSCRLVAYNLSLMKKRINKDKKFNLQVLGFYLNIKRATHMHGLNICPMDKLYLAMAEAFHYDLKGKKREENNVIKKLIAMCLCLPVDG